MEQARNGKPKSKQGRGIRERAIRYPGSRKAMARGWVELGVLKVFEGRGKERERAREMLRSYCQLHT